MLHAADRAPPGRPLMQTREGAAAKRYVIHMAVRHEACRGSYRCRVCGKRCEIEVTYDAIGAVAHSKGRCRTPDCIAWEE